MTKAKFLLLLGAGALLLTASVGSLILVTQTPSSGIRTTIEQSEGLAEPLRNEQAAPSPSPGDRDDNQVAQDKMFEQHGALQGSTFELAEILRERFENLTLGDPALFEAEILEIEGQLAIAAGHGDEDAIRALFDLAGMRLDARTRFFWLSALVEAGDVTHRQGLAIAYLDGFVGEVDVLEAIQQLELLLAEKPDEVHARIFLAAIYTDSIPEKYLSEFVNLERAREIIEPLFNEMQHLVPENAELILSHIKSKL